MKYSVGLVVCFSLLALSFAVPSTYLAQDAQAIQGSPSPSKEDKAFKECNATNPVQRYIPDVIAEGVVTGARINISPEEKCHFYCFLQKVGFFDQNGNFKGQGATKYALKETPEIAKYSDVLIAKMFQITQISKEIEDKCEKASVVYFQFLQGIYELFLANSLQSATGIKDQIENAIANGHSVNPNVTEQVNQFFKLYNKMISGDDNKFDQVENNAQQQASNAQSQVFNVQSQASNAQSQGSAYLQQQAQNVQSQVSDAQSQGSAGFQQQAQNAQSQVSNAKAQAGNAQSQLKTIF